jgi:hypothetical protein
LVAIIAAALRKRPAIDVIALAPIEFTAAPIAFHAVTLNVSNMFGEGANAGRSAGACNMDFDNDAAHACAADLSERLHRLRRRPIAATVITPCEAWFA